MPKIYAFDFDDNLLSMPSKMYTYCRFQPVILPIIIKYFQAFFSEYISTYTSLSDDEIFAMNCDENEISRFMSILPPHKVFHIHLEKLDPFIISAYILSVKDETLQQLTTFLSSRSNLNIKHDPSCINESRDPNRPLYHTKPIPIKNAFKNSNGCALCLQFSIFEVQSTMEYATTRTTGNYFHKNDSYISFRLPSSFLSSIFEAITTTSLLCQNAIENGVEVTKKFQSGLLPRNKMVYESLKRSYEYSKNLLKKTSQDDYGDDDSTDDSLYPCDPDGYRFLDLFACYDDEQGPPDHFDFFHELHHKLIVERLAWMFEPSQNDLLYETVHNIPIDPETPLEGKDARYGHFQLQDTVGPSLSRLLDAILANHPVTIITSRGNPAWSVQRGVLIILLYFLSTAQLIALTKHVARSQYSCLCDFVSHIPIYCVHNNYFLKYSHQIPRIHLDDECKDYSHLPPDIAKARNFLDNILVSAIDDPENPIDGINLIKKDVHAIFDLNLAQHLPETQKCIALMGYLNHVKASKNNMRNTPREKSENFIVGTNPAYHPGRRTLFSSHNHDIEVTDELLRNNFYYFTGCDYRYKMGRIYDGNWPKKNEILNFKELRQYKCFCNMPSSSPKAAIANINSTPAFSLEPPSPSFSLTSHTTPDEMKQASSLLQSLHHSVMAPIIPPTSAKASVQPLSNTTGFTASKRHSTNAKDHPHNFTTCPLSPQQLTPSKRKQSSAHRAFMQKSPYHSELHKNINYGPRNFDFDDQFDFDDEEEEEYDDNTFPSTPFETMAENITTTTKSFNTSSLYETDVSESEPGGNTPTKTPPTSHNLGQIKEQTPRFCLGFSDDDKRNIDAMEKFFLAKSAIHQEIRFVLYDTSKKGILFKKIITSDSDKTSNMYK